MSGIQYQLLGDFCDVSRGTNITRKSSVSGDVPVVAGGIKPTYFHNSPNRPANIVTISGSGANAGFVNYYDVPIFASDCTTVLPIDSSTHSVRYVYLYLLSRQQFINDELRQGAAQPHVYPRDIAKIPIPVPPLPEQQRIVAILDEAFAGIASVEESTVKNLASSQELYRSQIASMFSDLGSTWSYRPLKDVSENLDSFRKPITKSDRVSGEIPYYGASGIVDHIADFIFEEDLLAVSEDGANLLARTYPIAFPISGRSWVNNHAHVLRFESDSQQKVIEYYLNSIDLAPYVSGMAQPKLNQRSLNSIQVPWTEDRQFADQLSSSVEYIRKATLSLETVYEQKLRAFGELKQSILQKAFAGELTATAGNAAVEASP